MNATKSLEYVRGRDLDRRLDGRTALAIGWRGHRESLLALFGVSALTDLDALSEESLVRLVQRRLVREVSWSRIKAAIETDDRPAFDAEVERFQRSVDAEERSEKLLDERVREHRARREAPLDLRAYLAKRAPEHDPQDETPESPPDEANAAEGTTSQDAAHVDETEEADVNPEPEPPPRQWRCRCCSTVVTGDEPPEECAGCQAPDLFSEVHDGPKPEMGPAVSMWKCLRCAAELGEKPEYCPGCRAMDYFEEVSR